ncbi:hypothetical protein MUY35_16010 [Aliiroseovarius sp. S1339]|uniref:hypothetical protein n=1 Tax=Aliiroseovarius sp. S1339 TaxID=2936990 RepID=UPI0020BE1C5E|nr:hypothetical protein [Aliiroseovarius sp. S1339]MCK8465364.1 hypothetical protein [Aliiroseovarius sp. S1339]
MTFTTIQNATWTDLVAGVANPNIAATILCVSMGILIVAHAGLKLFVFAPAGNFRYSGQWL